MNITQIMEKTLCLFFLSLMALLSQAQTFKGSVTDDAGIPVPYASLYLREIKSGFTTDEHGHFQARLPQGHYTCEVSSLGFTSQTFSFTMPGHDYEKNFTLTERIYSLPQVDVLKGREDPAYAVMRHAIARAPYHRTRVKGFKAGTYLKGTGKGTSIPAVLKMSKSVRKASKEFLGKLFVLEEQQQVTFTAPDVWNSKVIAYKNSFPEELPINMGMIDVNLYSPWIFDKVSPLNKRAFSYYRFRLDGYYQENGRMINKIRVIPKKQDARLLEGDIFIVEDLWSISAADFNIRESGLKGRVRTTCKEVQPSVFLPVSTTMSADIDMMGFKAEASYLTAIHYTEVRTDAEPTIDAGSAVPTAKTPALSPKKRKYELPTHIARKDTQTDSLAGKRDSLYWASVRSVPLRTEELQSYRLKDEKILRKDSLPAADNRPPTAVGKALNAFFWGETFHTSNRKAWLTFPGLPAYIPEYNFVDGFWLGVKLKSGVKLSPSSTLSFSPSFYYVTARKSWVGQGKLTLDYAPLRRGRIGLTGGVTSADYNGESGESRLINSVSSSLFGHNHIKFYESTFFTAEHAIEPFNGLFFTASLSWQRRKILENHIHKSWFKREAEPNLPRNDAFRPMPPNDILKASFGLEYTPAHYYRIYQGRKVYENSRFPTFTLRYDRAFPAEGSRYLTSYHLMQFSARQQIGFGMFNRLHWSVNAGAFFHAVNLQFPDFKHFASTHIAVTDCTFDTGFSLPDNYALSTDTRWAQAHVSWYTPYLLLKQLPWFSRKSFDEALHLRSIVTYARQPYTEAGYSVGFSTLARIGVFVGFDALKFHSAGISVSLPFSAFALQ